MSNLDIYILLSTLHERYDLSPADMELVKEACERLKSPAIDWVAVITLVGRLLIAGSTLQ